MLLVQVLQQHQSHHSCYQSPWIIKSKLQCLILCTGCGWVGNSKLPLLEPKWPEWQTSHPPSNSLQIVLHENSACYFFISRQFHIVVFHHPPTALPFCSGWCVQSKPCCWYRFSNSIKHTTAAINPLGSSSQSCSVSSSVLCAALHFRHVTSRPPWTKQKLDLP